MLRYTAHHLELAGRHYLPLPKLNAVQVSILSARLRGLGYAVERGTILRASSRAGSVCVAPGGLCWSSHDPADEVLPVVPALAGIPKEGLSLDAIGSLYFGIHRDGSRGVVRLFSRLETSSSWDKLRASGECGLTPDEQLVARQLLKNLGSMCRMVTDFPTGGSVQLRRGGRMYFLSKLDPQEASSTLRAIGEKGRRNSYLPRDGVVGFNGGLQTSPMNSELVGELGEWCSFKASR